MVIFLKYYFVGIKGTGMSALALCIYDIKETVIGSDNNKFYFTEERLKE